VKSRPIEYESRIDVAPIINVSLVVVLTLMLIAPFLHGSDKGVDLPVAHASEVDDTDDLEITLTLEQEIYIGDEQVALAEVQPLVKAIFAGGDGGVAVIKADRQLQYGQVEQLIAAVEKGGAPRIAIATRQRQEGAAR
jgi:biopolymer transport protein TolR